MSLGDWHRFGWIKPHQTDERELGNLLAIADRDICDATAGDLSNDWKFGIAYNAALKFCTMLLYDAGYMPEKSLAHFRTLLSLEFTLGAERKSDAQYLDACRIKRNHVEYDYVDGASEAEATELVEFVKSLRVDVLAKLRSRYPGLGLPQEDEPVVGAPA